MISFKVERVAFKETYTIGKFYYKFSNGEWLYLCDVLEDRVRDNNNDGDLTDKGESKVYGETAIPSGKYKFKMAFSPHFKRNLPLLINVPMFSGILIHGGNTISDTYGCLLVGENKVKGKVVNSQITLARLLNIIDHNIQPEYDIEIINKR